jgi:Family of unknown function (DUF6476)
MRGLKILVVVMGIMLVVGFATLVAVIAGRISRSGPTPSPAHAFAAAPIDIPRGARRRPATCGDRFGQRHPSWHDRVAYGAVKPSRFGATYSSRRSDNTVIGIFFGARLHVANVILKAALILPNFSPTRAVHPGGTE